MGHRLLDLLVNANIVDPDPVRQWRLNAFFGLLNVSLLCILLPMTLLLLLLQWWAYALAQAGIAAAFAGLHAPIHRKRLHLAVNAFNVLSTLSLTLCFLFASTNDFAYLYFFVVLISSLFLGRTAAAAWTAIITILLLIIAAQSPTITLFPPLAFLSDAPVAKAGGYHLSSALTLVWIGLFLGILLESFFQRLFAKLMRRNRALHQEIETRIEAEESLRHSEQQFRTLIESSLQGLVIVQNWKIIFANRAFADTVGYATEELYGMTVKQLKNLVHEEDRERATGVAMDNALSRGEQQRQVLRLVRPDGTLRWVETFAISSTFNGQPAVQGLTIDVTEQKRAEDRKAELEQKFRQIERMEAIGQVAGGIAHDFNNQLTGILGNIKMLLLKSNGNPSVDKYATNIQNAVNRSSDLTGKLLSFARKRKLLFVRVDIHRVIHEVVAMLEHSFEGRIAVRLQLDADPPLARGDPTQLHSVFLNLALNASDAMPEGGTLAFATKLVELGDACSQADSESIQPGRYVKTVVADTGCGLSSEIAARMFEPFFTTKPKGRGTGLGLAAAYGTIRSHKGAIDVQSGEGEGTKISVLLPVYRPVKGDLKGASGPAEDS